MRSAVKILNEDEIIETEEEDVVIKDPDNDVVAEENNDTTETGKTEIIEP